MGGVGGAGAPQISAQTPLMGPGGEELEVAAVRAALRVWVGADSGEQGYALFGGGGGGREIRVVVCDWGKVMGGGE